MLDFYNDDTIKIEYNPQSNQSAFTLNVVGPSSGETLTVYSGITPTDLNTIYVNKTSGNDTTGDGTSALPYATILKGIQSCTTTKVYVIVQDSETYAEDLTTVSNTYFTALYADTAQTPLLSKRVLGYTPTDSNSIFVNATTGNDTTGAGTAANPYATITKGAAECDATHQAVVITDSTTYTDSGIEFTGNFLGLYAQIGQTPTWTPDKDADFLDLSLFGAIKEESSFISSESTYISTGIFSNDYLVTAYSDADDSNIGKFVIQNSEGVVLVSPTTFDTGPVDWVCLGVLSDDTFVIAYSYSSTNGKFVIYDSDGTEILSPTIFDTTQIFYSSMGILSDDRFVIAYSDIGDSNKGKFVIYDSDGTVDVSAVTFNNASTTYSWLDILSDDRIVIAYSDDGDGDKGKFVIYDSDGTVDVSAVTFDADRSLYISVSVFSDDSFVIAYYNTIDIDGQFTIYDSTGTIAVASTTFDSSASTFTAVKVLANDYFVIPYQVSATGKLAIYDSTGTIAVASTTFGSSGAAYTRCVLTSADNFVITYSDGTFGIFVIYYPYGYSGIEVSASSEINGIIFDSNNTNKIYYMIKGTADLNIVNCEIKKVDENILPTGHSPFAIYSDSEINMQNCSVHENGAGIYTAENASIIQDSIFYKNTKGTAIHIDGAATSSGDITIEHCTIFSNESGIQLENNNGTNEILKNLILHSNDNLGIEADTDVTYSYSTNTDTLSNVTAGTDILVTNPLFKNEGALDVDDTDLNLKYTLLGDTTTSPAIDLADDDRDAGAYNRTIIGSQTTWSEMTIFKPFDGVEVWTDPVTAVKNIRRNGSVVTSREALTETIRLKYAGVSNADYLEMLGLLQQTNSQVRIYPDPVTNPNDYNLYVFVYGTINGSADHYKLTRTGKKDITLVFARATE